MGTFNECNVFLVVLNMPFKTLQYENKQDGRARVGWGEGVL